MSATTEAAVTLPLTFRVGIPPKSLGKGSSVGWYQVRRDYADAKTEAMVAIRNRLTERRQEIGDPFPALVMDIWWTAWHPRHIPDADNVITRTAAIRDVMQDMGLVLDDGVIQIGSVERIVGSKRAAGVLVTIRAREGAG